MKLNNTKIIYSALLLVSIFLTACGGGGGSTAAQLATAITAQPTDQSVVSGTAATFDVVASNATGYQWQRSSDGGTTYTVVSGATTDSYATAATTLADSGTLYRVVVSGTSNSVTSSAVTLAVTTVAGGPAITVQPTSAHVTALAAASFSVTATGTSLSYQWQRCMDAIATCVTWSNIANATLSTYSTGNTDTAMSGQRYRVVVSNTVGSVESAAVTLTVDPTPVAPVITGQPVDVTVVAPAAASFSVAFTGVPTPMPRWQYYDGSNWVNAGVAVATFTINTTTASDNGRQYRVIIESAAGRVTSNVVTLSVNAAAIAPAFTTQPANVTITEGQNAQFTVAVSGAPTPALQWQLSTDSGGNWSNINGETGTILNLSSAALANNGRQFRAVATNSSGTVNSSAATLTVNAALGSKAFGTAALIETGAGAAAQPQIAVDPSGNAVAVWVQVDSTGTYLNIWANHYTVATHTWGTAAPLETGVGFSSNPQIAIDANGNALAVWQQDGDATAAVRDDIWANRYSASSGTWGTAVLIETDNAGPAVSPQIAFDLTGNAMAVWLQSNGTSSQIRSNSYSAGSGTWGTTATIIEPVSLGASSTPQIAIDANGNALVVWSRYDGTGTIMSNRYAAGSGWGAASVIGGAGGLPQIAIDANGNALAVWSQSDGSNRNIWANRYSAGSGWGTAALIEWTGGDADNPQIAFDVSGNALAVWQQNSGFGTNERIWSNRYTAGSGWGGFPALIQTDISGGSTANAVEPQIVIDAASGNALAVWVQPDGASDNTPDIWINRYTPGSGWGTTANLGQVRINTAGAPAGQPQIAIDANGNAVVVWYQSDGTNDSIWYNRYQ
ncbi:MAG TPA: hypothetical protein VMV48_06165 [Gallionellaceae bacterium]|nr:hypothetical protein [Gallionellaceae bacterium]